MKKEHRIKTMSYRCIDCPYYFDNKCTQNSKCIWACQPKTKKERLENKKQKITMHKLVKKYPWLINRNVWTGEKIKNSLAMYPDDYGWFKMFFYDMCNEIDAELKKTGDTNSFHILEVKEKFGELRIYTSACSREVYDIIDKYTVLSRHLCIKCGNPNARVTKGWIEPFCKKCLKDDERWNTLEEEEFPMYYKYTRFSKEGDCTFTVDISDTSKKIIRRWNRKHPKQKVDII